MPSRSFIFYMLTMAVATGILHAERNAAKTTPPLDDHRVIKRGDFLSLQVREMDSAASIKHVNEEGEIKVAYVPHTLKAAGLTCRAFSESYARELKKHFHTRLVVWVQFTETSSPVQTETAQHNTKLQPGWVVSISIAEDKREPLQQSLTPDGEVMAPYVGFVKASGLTCSELANKIKLKLEKDLFKNATVLVTLDLRRVYFGEPLCTLEDDWVAVFGNIKKTGKHALPYDKDLTISDLLKKVGGYSGPNAVPKIKIVRRTLFGDKMILADTHSLLTRGSKAHDLFLRNHDVMLVE